MWVILVVLAILFLFGMPTYPYSRGWGWGPSGILGFLFLVFLLMLIFGGARP
jgi:hypothetical protein